MEKTTLSKVCFGSPNDILRDENDDSYSLLNLDDQGCSQTATKTTYTINGTPETTQDGYPVTLMSPEVFMTDLSPQLDSDGDIKCGQPQYPQFTTVGRDEYQLNGLPKDLYISRLLEKTMSSEETLYEYRLELAAQARSCENPPIGILKDRRNSTKETVAEKYAHDCFLLGQFIQGNTNDVSQLFKRQNSSKPKSTCDTTQCEAPEQERGVSHDIMLLKNSLSSLQSEVTLLKAESKETKQQLETFSNETKSTIDCIKKELESCSVLTPDGSSTKTIAESLKLITNQLKKLETSRNQMHAELLTLCGRVTENSRNITNVQDSEVQRKNALKIQLQSVNDRLDENSKQKDSESVNSSLTKLTTELTNKISLMNKNMTESLSMMANTFSETIVKQNTMMCDKLTSSLDRVTKITDASRRNMSSTTEEVNGMTFMNSCTEQHDVTDHQLNKKSPPSQTLTGKTLHSKPEGNQQPTGEQMSNQTTLTATAILKHRHLEES